MKSYLMNNKRQHMTKRWTITQKESTEDSALGPKTSITEISKTQERDQNGEKSNNMKLFGETRKQNNHIKMTLKMNLTLSSVLKKRTRQRSQTTKLEELM